MPSPGSRSGGGGAEAAPRRRGAARTPAADVECLELLLGPLDGAVLRRVLVPFSRLLVVFLLRAGKSYNIIGLAQLAKWFVIAFPQFIGVQLLRPRFVGLLDLLARRVETQDEFDRFSDAYEEKYSTRPRNENVNEAYLFRLTAP